ncbi:MAG: hypothetical protein H6Q38_1000, partial [Chloroflexi bacterium]|nr:hypothetical protein [Chloroflexota bacterium]
VAEQNLQTSATQASQVRGQVVCLLWNKEHNRPLDADPEQTAHLQEEITGEALVE